MAIALFAMATCAVVAALVIVLPQAAQDGLEATPSQGWLSVVDHAAGARLPWQTSVDDDYPSASECARCHPTHVAEWRGSAHARAATDPLVHASVCGRCHAPLGTQFDELYQLKLYDGTPMSGVPEAAAEGVTCVTCHSRAHTPDEQVLTFEPTWPNWRSSDLALEIMPFDPARGTFGSGSDEDPSAVPNDSHDSLQDPTLTSSELCRPCHEVVVDKEPLAPHRGLYASPARVELLTTYGEWDRSPYSVPGDGYMTCQSCHMPTHPGRGPAAVAPHGTEYDRPLPDRDLTSHAITGVSSDYLSSGPSVDNQEKRVADRVLDAAAIHISVPTTVTIGSPLDVTVVITNTGAGHDLPTGFDFWSEAWLELVLADSDGTVLLASGDLDDEEWLRDEFNPRVVDGSLPYDEFLYSLRARLVSVGPNRARWLQEDGTLRIPRDEIARNRNGTPIIGPDADVALAIASQLYPDAEPPIATFALQEGYYLRHADVVLRHGIPARDSRTPDYSIDLDASVVGPLAVSARLLIRSSWPWMLQQQQELPTPRPRPRIYEIAAAEATVELAEP